MVENQPLSGAYITLFRLEGDCCNGALLWWPGTGMGCKKLVLRLCPGEEGGHVGFQLRRIPGQHCITDSSC